MELHSGVEEEQQTECLLSAPATSLCSGHSEINRGGKHFLSGPGDTALVQTCRLQVHEKSQARRSPNFAHSGNQSVPRLFSKKMSVAARQIKLVSAAVFCYPPDNSNANALPEISGSLSYLELAGLPKNGRSCLAHFLQLLLLQGGRIQRSSS